MMDMSMDLLISLTTLVVLAMMSFIMFQMYRYNKQAEERSERKLREMALSLQREKIEQRIYSANDQLTATTFRFEEANSLIYNRRGESVSLSNQLIEYDSFFKGVGIDLNELCIKKGQITCLMPFHKTYEYAYNHIKKACSDTGYTCLRSDTPFDPNNILKHTIELILESQIIIGVVDGRNPNVYYEIGIAHSVGKPVILISKASRDKSIPFNVRSNRFIFYKKGQDLVEQLASALNSVKQVETKDVN